MSNQIIKKNRRTFIKGLFAMAMLKKLFTNSSHAEEESNYLLNGPLAGSFYYTKNKPGRWSQLVESHIPIHRIDNKILQISTFHEMKGYDHYIIKHIILLTKIVKLIMKKLRWFL